MRAATRIYQCQDCGGLFQDVEPDCGCDCTALCFEPVTPPAGCDKDDLAGQDLWVAIYCRLAELGSLSTWLCHLPHRATPQLGVYTAGERLAVWGAAASVRGWLDTHPSYSP